MAWITWMDTAPWRYLRVPTCGEAMWIPMGNLSVAVPRENQTSYPSRGELLLYRDGASETEILIPYGNAKFASKVGLLAGNHFLTVVDGLSKLEVLGKQVLWSGAQDIQFSLEASATEDG